MPMWLLILVEVIPAAINFVKDIIAIWDEIKQLSPSQQPAAKAQLKSALSAARQAPDAATRHGIFARLLADIKARRANA
jgi:hypothetical protein